MAKHRSDAERNRDGILAARLLSEREPRSEIMQVLNISPATLTRDLKEAGDKYLEVHYTFDDELLKQLHPDLYDEIMDFHIGSGTQEAMRRKFGENTPVVTVVSQDSSDVKAPSLEKFSAPAAARVQRLISKCSLVGLTWGGTVRAVATQIQADRSRRRIIRFVPLVGESPHSENYAIYSASTISLELNQRLNAHLDDRLKILSLSSVPLMLPIMRKSVEKEVRNIVMGQSAAYTEIYGVNELDKKIKLIDRLDAIIIGAGSAEHLYGYIHAPLFDDDHDHDHQPLLTRSQLKKLVFGDIAGHLFPKPGIAQRNSKNIDRINGTLIGLQLSHLKDCVKRCKRSGKPGVILLATGASKANIVRCAIEAGLVSHLVIDQSLNNALVGPGGRLTTA